MKSIILVSRILVGLVFVFSGFVKAIDPSGSAIKFEEYFLAFHLDFLTGIVMPLAILQNSAELMVGLNLLAGIRLKLTSWFLLIFMLFYLVLTLVLALTNPVTDCGCFGDALKLTNWQTFAKNAILIVPTVLIFIYRNNYRHLPITADWLLAAANFILPTLLSVYCLIHQPLLDFRPYKTGISIPEKMIIPAGAATDKYDTELVYQKDGIQKSFSESNYPWQDTTWKWVETKQKLISRGYEPPIHDFSITSPRGEDITSRVLTDSNYVLLIIAPKLEKASKKGMNKMNELSMKANNLGFDVYCLTSSVSQQIDIFTHASKPAFTICTSDETTLKTIIRANPGLILLREGTILGKWNFPDAPAANEFRANPLSLILEKDRSTHEKSIVVILIFGILLFYLLVFRIFGLKIVI